MIVIVWIVCLGIVAGIGFLIAKSEVKDKNKYEKKKYDVIKGLYYLKSDMSKSEVQEILGHGIFVDYDKYSKIRKRYNPYNYSYTDIEKEAIYRSDLRPSEEIIYYTGVFSSTRGDGYKYTTSKSQYLVLIVFHHDRIKYVLDSSGSIIIDFRSDFEKKYGL